MRVAIYVRVSTEEQKKHGLSVDSQIEALTQYCGENNYSIVGIYNDAGISARKKYTKRPALMKLLDDCQADKVDLIIFTKLDRWFRSVADYYQVQTILDACKVPWRAIWEDYETETANGVFKVNIMLSVAQSEADRTGERIKAVNEYRRAQGMYVGGNAPTGYIKKDSGLIKDASCADAVQAFFDAYSSMHSMSIARAKAEELGLSIAKATAVRMLHNTAYYGNASGYQCEPYISLEQFNDNQLEMSRHSRQTTKANHEYLFSGLLICADCGAHITSKYSCDSFKNGTKAIRLGYECARHRNMPSACAGGYYGQKKLEKYILDNLDIELSKAQFNAKLVAKKSPNVKKRKDLEKRLERLKILFEEGDITVDAYKAKRDDIKKALANLQCDDIRTVVSLPKNWLELYNSLDFEHKRAFYRDVFEAIYLSKNKPPVFKFK